MNNKKYISIIKGIKRQGYEIKEYIASTYTIEKLSGYYSDFSKASKTEAGSLSLSADVVEDLAKNMNTIDELRGEFEKTLKQKHKYLVSLILEIIIGGALGLRSSDIHIEPYEKKVFLRFRIDGVLVKVKEIELDLFKKITSRLKIISGLKINVTNQAQDGRFTIKLPKKKVEVRVSTVPGATGEAIVMRLLDPEGVVRGLEHLGFHHSLFDAFIKEIKKPNGMIITTGPTGSGKTTTLYACLKEIYTPEIKIFTLEDPVEYKLEGIVQTQIDKEYSFAKGLRAALRQDPDVILVGEIRDKEVAKTAVDAALTGHIVFSTLHTNDAAGALPRLIEMGIAPKAFSSAVNLIMAQRLVRRLCDECRQKVTLTKEQKQNIEKMVEEMPESIQKEVAEIGYENIYEPLDDCETKCAECAEGYRGLIGVYEAIVVTTNIERVLVEGGGTLDIREAANKQGLMTIQEDCLLKVLKGATSISEMTRVVGLTI